MAEYHCGWVCFLFTASKMPVSYLMLLLFSPTFPWSLSIYFLFYSVALLKIIMPLYSALIFQCAKVIICLKWGDVRTHCYLTEYWHFSEVCSLSHFSFPCFCYIQPNILVDGLCCCLVFPHFWMGGFLLEEWGEGEGWGWGGQVEGRVGWGESLSVRLLSPETLGRTALSLCSEECVVPWLCRAACPDSTRSLILARDSLRNVSPGFMEDSCFLNFFFILLHLCLLQKQYGVRSTFTKYFKNWYSPFSV